MSHPESNRNREYIVMVPEFCASGYVAARFYEGKWLEENDFDITKFVEGYYPIDKIEFIEE